MNTAPIDLNIDPRALGKVAVLYGGNRAERLVSLMSGPGVLGALQGLGVDVVLEAEDGQALLDALDTQRVDVVLSDIRMPGLDGIEALRQLRARGDATPWLLLTTFDESDLLLRASEAWSSASATRIAAGLMPATARSDACRPARFGPTPAAPVRPPGARACRRCHCPRGCVRRAGHHRGYRYATGIPLH